MKPMFKASEETLRIVALFSEMSFGQEMSFAAASEILKFPIASTSSAYQSGKFIATRDHSIVIEGIRGHGFKRLDGGENWKFQNLGRISKRHFLAKTHFGK